MAKNINHFFLFLIACLLSLSPCYAQYPKNDFRSPIDTTIKLAGNFGEIRNNHFHMGLDIRTNSMEGMKIFAVGDGYVSRIKVSATGYGKNVFVTHPNGYVSVYCHLQRYSGKVADYVKKAQYSAESFEVELFPKPGELTVKKGELIALSGNTGGSQGPHLHFEIRDAKTEDAINPLFFGFDVKDTEKPRINAVYVYPASDNSLVNNRTSKARVRFRKDTLKVSGPVGFAIDTYDSENYSANINQTFCVELSVDDKKIYTHKMDDISFDDFRAVNSHVDYMERKKIGRNIQKSFIAKNNPLKIYKDIKSGGVVNITDNLVHKVNYVVKDFFDNQVSYEFYIKYSKPFITINPTKPASTNFFDCKKPNSFKATDITIDFSEKCFYEDFYFTYSVKPAVSGVISQVHQVHNTTIPVHALFTISIKPKAGFEKYKDKMIIVWMDEKGWKKNEGGEYKNGYVTTQTKTLGTFAVAVDTMPPYVAGVNISQGRRVSKYRAIKLKVGDALSGVKYFKATVDGKFVLFDYEPKQSLLFHEFDGTITKGKHHFVMEVFDAKGNSKKVSYDFVY